MVQVIKTGNPQGKLAETLGMSLGQGLGQGLNTFYANKAIDEVLQDPELKDAPLSQKWQRLSSDLAKYGETGQQLLQNRLQSEQQALQEKEQGVLSNIASGEKVTAKERASLSPKTQLSVLQYEQKKEQANKKLTTDTLSNESFSKGYKAILDNDTDTLKEVIADPNTPLNVKTQLGSIQNQFANRTDVKERDTSRRLNNIQESYRKAIATERARLGKHGGLRKTDVEAINERIAGLEKARDKDMQKFLKNPENYTKLSIWGNPEMANYLPSYESEIEEESTEEPQKKIKLETEENRRNAAKTLLRKHNGNQQEAMAEFESLYE
jgi:hypothetical protein